MFSLRQLLGTSVQLEKEIKSNKLKIGVAILSCDRPEYLEKCLDSLFKTKLYNYDVTFLISDDGSTNPKVREIISQKRDSKYKIVTNFTPKGHNSWAGAFNKAMKKLLETDDFDVVGTCDDDALFHPEWLNQMIKICRWAKKHHRDHILGPFSAFNSSDLEFHHVLGEYHSPYGNYWVKERMGAVSYFYFKNDFLKLGYYDESRDDETLMTEKFKRLGVRYFCTETSYVEHLGQNSILNQWRPVPVKKAVSGINLVKFGWGVDLEKISPYGFYRYIKGSNTFGENIKSRSKWKLDVVIPVIKKDLETLPLVVNSIRKYLRHPVGKIIIFGPKDIDVINFCNKHKCEFVNELDVLSISPSDIDYKIDGYNRAGWIYQQLIKLSVDKISAQKHVLVIDADTMLTQPQKFEIRGKQLLLVSDEFHWPYVETFRRVFGYNPIARFSFVSHQMLFDTKRLRQLKHEIEKDSGVKWFEKILASLDKKEISSFSEYETYGNWMLINYPNEVKFEYWFNYSCPRDLLNRSKFITNIESGHYRSISFHVSQKKMHE